MPTEAPSWFCTAVAAASESHLVMVNGAAINYRSWGTCGHPVAVLVHGGGANASWWDHIAPWLTATHRVLALDLSGHGDSDWQAPYTLDAWAAQVVAVAMAEDAPAPPVIVGHSLGGLVALTAARLVGTDLLGAAIVDSPVPARAAADESSQGPPKRSRPFRARATYDDIIAQFRTLLPDPGTLSYVTDHIARRSVRSVDDGWTWKFDPAIYGSAQLTLEELSEVGCPVAFITGERGLATPALAAQAAARLGGHVSVTVIPDAGHHIMLDQPVALASALQVLLGQWHGRALRFARVEVTGPV